MLNTLCGNKKTTRNHLWNTHILCGGRWCSIYPCAIQKRTSPAALSLSFLPENCHWNMFTLCTNFTRHLRKIYSAWCDGSSHNKPSSFLKEKGTFAWTSRTYGPSVLVFGTNGATNFDSYFHFPHAHNIMQILNAEFVRSYLDLSYLSLKTIEINKMQFSIHVYEKMSAHALLRFWATTVFSCVFLLYTHHATKSSSNMIWFVCCVCSALFMFHLRFRFFLSVCCVFLHYYRATTCFKQGFNCFSPFCSIFMFMLRFIILPPPLSCYCVFAAFCENLVRCMLLLLNSETVG